MTPSHKPGKPRTFFLNETHELTPVEKPGGGRLPEFAHIPWASKAKTLNRSLKAVFDHVQSSDDPLRDDRYFVIAQPVDEIEKKSDNKKKAPHGTYKEKTEFGGSHGRVFDRLGLDLLQVTDDGKAVVHAEKEKFEQLLNRSAALDSLGRREQSRWATIESFDTIPLQLRVDGDWLRTLKQDVAADVVFELQPVLSRVEADRVLRAIADLLAKGKGEKLTGTGSDFSGRFWFRGQANQRSVRLIAKDFYSVQSLHSPLYSVAAGKARVKTVVPALRPAEQAAPGNINELPCVAVVDLGVPVDHSRLRKFRRGQFIPQGVAAAPVGDHGSFVASRVVFGDPADQNHLLAATGQCSFYDALVGAHPTVTGQTNRVDDKVVMAALDGVRGAAPDVRVFNLSFGDSRPLNAFPEVERREKRLSLQDLDNFVFANDKIVVVAAGNSLPGTIPNPDYPNHHADDRWALGPWACGFNTLICGAFVSRLSTNGLVQSTGWPSPFTRIGPGLCDAPIPSFSAEGGNTDDAYRYRPDLGVWGFSGAGLPEDRIGTSFAAPILAREAALALSRLQDYCAPGTQPFGVTARAFLTLTAEPPTGDDEVQTLAERALGHGKASMARLVRASVGSAVILWQGLIESPNDTVRVQLPIPLDWLAEADEPVLRLVVCYDPPVNEAAHATWSCRKVKPVLHAGPDVRGATAPRGAHHSFPVIDRQYRLSRYKPGEEKAAESDMWLLELSYDEVAPYTPGMDFDPRQRVAFAAELYDLGDSSVDPQAAMQALPIAATMNRLSIQPQAIRSPIIVRTRSN